MMRQQDGYVWMHERLEDGGIRWTGIADNGDIHTDVFRSTIFNKMRACYFDSSGKMFFNSRIHDDDLGLELIEAM